MRSLLPGLRRLEALLLSALAGAFVWILGLHHWLPVLSFAFLGFLAGGTVTLNTAGFALIKRSSRRRLALVCGLVAVASLHVLRYVAFVRHATADVRALDHRQEASEAAAVVQQTLRHETGQGGALGFLLGELAEGAPVLGVRVRGPALVGLRLVELAVAIAVAMRWASGPAALDA